MEVEETTIKGSARYKKFRSPMALHGGRRQCGIHKFLQASSLFFQKAINLCGQFY